MIEVLYSGRSGNIDIHDTHVTNNIYASPTNRFVYQYLGIGMLNVSNVTFENISMNGGGGDTFRMIFPQNSANTHTIDPDSHSHSGHWYLI